MSAVVVSYEGVQVVPDSLWMQLITSADMSQLHDRSGYIITTVK